MHRITLLILTAAFAAFAPSVLVAQSHFKQCASMTGSDGTIIIPERADIRVNGSAIPVNSEIAVFTENGTCAGVVVWKKRATGLSIWGDDALTKARDGFKKGETLLFRIWDPSSGKEYDGAKQSATVRFETGRAIFKSDRSYGENAIYVLRHLSIGSQKPQKKKQKEKRVAAPVLRSPLDQATRQAIKLELTWRPVEGAKHYSVQISTSSKFKSKRTTSANTRSLAFSPPKLRPNVIYYWRVRAVSKDGAGSWSTVRRFRTAPRKGKGERRTESGAAGADGDAATQAELAALGGGSAGQDLPDRFELYPNYPNPFNPSTTIRFDVPQPSPVRITIYNAAGAEVEVLVNRAMDAGSHRVVWDAGGRPSGIYFCRIQAGSWSAVRSLVLLR